MFRIQHTDEYRLRDLEDNDGSPTMGIAVEYELTSDLDGFDFDDAEDRRRRTGSITRFSSEDPGQTPSGIWTANERHHPLSFEHDPGDPLRIEREPARVHLRKTPSLTSPIRTIMDLLALRQIPPQEFLRSPLETTRDERGRVLGRTPPLHVFEYRREIHPERGPIIVINGLPLADPMTHEQQFVDAHLDRDDMTLAGFSAVLRIGDADPVSLFL